MRLGPLMVGLGLLALVIMLQVPIEGVGIFLGFVGAMFVLWRLSVALAPEKKCWHCDGRGSNPGLLGGLRVCGWCKGSGRIPRIGAGGE